ncbi:MAG: hypothetical protein ACI8X5_002671 [Planctomycetota bacterium]|jgi:hypothetical protein
MTSSTREPTNERRPLWPVSLSRAERLRIARRALVLSAAERRTKRALFFLTSSLLVGFTVAGWKGLLGLGLFGGSLYLVVLVLRMERHIRAGVLEHQAKSETN